MNQIGAWLCMYVSIKAVLWFEQSLHLVWAPSWPFFEKQVNVHCDIGSVSMPIASYIHDAASQPIAKNSCQSYFKKFEVPFSRKQQSAIRTDWKIYSGSFYHFCLVVAIFQVATSLSIFSTAWPSLAQYKKQTKSNHIFTYANWNINLIIGFGNHA